MICLLLLLAFVLSTQQMPHLFCTYLLFLNRMSSYFSPPLSTFWSYSPFDRRVKLLTFNGIEDCLGTHIFVIFMHRFLNYLPIILFMAVEDYKIAVFPAFCPFNSSWFWISHCGMLHCTKEFVSVLSDGYLMPQVTKVNFFFPVLSYISSKLKEKM